MKAPAHDNGRLALMLNELRLPTIGRLWPEFAERSDKEGWQASRLLGALFEHDDVRRHLKTLGLPGAPDECATGAVRAGFSRIYTEDRALAIRCGRHRGFAIGLLRLRGAYTAR
jgi:hypothetical protein